SDFVAVGGVDVDLDGRERPAAEKELDEQEVVDVLAEGGVGVHAAQEDGFDFAPEEPAGRVDVVNGGVDDEGAGRNAVGSGFDVPVPALVEDRAANRAPFELAFQRLMPAVESAHEADLHELAAKLLLGSEDALSIGDGCRQRFLTKNGLLGAEALSH